MEYCVLSSEGATGDPVEIRRLIRCPGLEQRVLRFDGAGGERLDPAADELLYVLCGGGRATIGENAAALRPGTAAFVPHGTPWRIDGASELELLSVLVQDPLPGGGPAVIQLDSQEAGAATAGRMFRVLAGPDAGCASATQFVGYVPTVRAPDHYHRYDEVAYILAGRGVLHVDGETEQLAPGAAIHFPAGLVHCLENPGPDELQVLGVFRPAGSPAEAYYPDGRKAEY